MVKKVKKKLYVDDLNAGVYSVDGGINLCKKLKVRFQEPKLNLRNWQSNNEILREFMKSLNVNPTAKGRLVKSDVSSKNADSRILQMGKIWKAFGNRIGQWQ